MAKFIINVIDMLLVVLSHKRMKALYWAIAGMVTAELAMTVPETFTEFSVPGWVVVFTGLVLAQMTKAISNKFK